VIRACANFDLRTAVAAAFAGLVDDVLERLQMVAGVAAHDLAFLSRRLAVLECPACALDRVAADLVTALGVFPGIKIHQTAQPVRDGPPPHVGLQFLPA
jgi:hypothetical protein